MADQTLARYVNELGVLTALRTEGAVSRADLARRLSLTPATITRIVSDLAGQGLVREAAKPAQAGAAREVGRPGIGISLNPAGAYFLGVEIGVGVMRFALLDLSADVVVSSTLHVPKGFPPEEAVRLTGEHAAGLEADKRYRDRIRSMGVTVPGLVRHDGFILNLPILGWKETNLGTLLAASVRYPSVVENNANAAAFGSVYAQPAAPSACKIFLKLGTGCGGAAIVNGRLLRGASGTAGEMGHIRITARGHRCSCGQVGCLESWVNLGALARSFTGTDDLDDDAFEALPAGVVNAAARGDRKAEAAIASLAKHLGMGIVSLVNIFNPDTIVLGGVMRPLLETCIDEIRSAVAAGIVPGTHVPEIRISLLGEAECAIGAASLAHHRAFDISNVELAEARLSA